jgi:hypothetical protein
MPTKRQVSRRTLFKAASAAAFGAPLLISSKAFGANDRITAGIIGLGGPAGGGGGGTEKIAVCDVREDKLKGYRGNKNITIYTDFRELLARDDVDAVFIGTPDHWHCLPAIAAAKAGKDIYCEKPISITVRQGRRLAEAVRRYGRVFQTGSQYRSIPTIRQVCEFVRAGGLGRVKSVFTLWTSLRGFFRAARFKPYIEGMDVQTCGSSYVPLDIPLPAEPVPEGLDWDLWVGPALWHSYNPAYHTNPSPGVVPWSFCKDFGAVSVTWHHSHSADVVQYALGAENSGPVEFIHPNSGEYPTLTCRYANGTLLHLVDRWPMVKELYKAVPATARSAGNFGGVFVGERGWVTSMSTGGLIEGGPENLFEEMKLRTRQVNIGENNHHANWFECIRTRRKPSSNEEIGHRSASLGHLIIIAHTLQRSLKWDPVGEEFIGDEAANRLLFRAMRAPWHI